MEAQAKALRWAREFENFKAEAIILFGSVLRVKSYNDADVLLLVDSKKHAVVRDQVKEKNTILIKPVHPVWQTLTDLEKNLTKPDKVVIEILKTGVVLKGQETIAKVLEHVARRKF